MISKCIEHDACRYDGSMIASRFVKDLSPYVTFVPVCPEVAIGLTVPREALRIVREEGLQKLVTSLSGSDYTKQMTDFSETYCQSLDFEGFHGVILKSRSPSCGIKDVKTYGKIGKASCLPEKSEGFFGASVMHHHPYLAVEDEGRLLNYGIREHFLTRIFVAARFEEVKTRNTMAALVQFHSENKYLLMAYHQTEQKNLGKVVANHEKLSLASVLSEYEIHLKKALYRPMKKGRNTNMILHIFGYVSKALTPEEKA
ncbi:MAG: DUF1722 domain-containing protein, partial [Clostridia bacterium]|nr:DUF1722 domain-containing protein [Clostridia bacterium]